ncbi:MAG: sensor histidine kinase [Actinomycetota bacterium]|nr:sensor histidine kinase [Actinomycetota bacterium]
MKSVRAGTGRLGSFFAFYSSALNPDRPEPSADRGTITSPRDGALGSVRWWWVLATGAGVGIMSYLLLYPVIFSYVLILSLLDRDVQSSVMQFGYAYGAWGMPMMHMLLMIFATSWTARRVGAAAVTHGVLIALVSVVVMQGIVLYDAPPLDLGEAATYLVMALAGGLLGGFEGRNVVAGQEALYQASRGISAARDPQAVLAAIHDYLAGPAVAGVALWQAPVRTEDTSPNGSGTLETRKPWFSLDWPRGVDFDGLDLTALTGADGRFARTLRAEDLPARSRAAWKSRSIRSAFLLPLVTPGSARVWLLAVASRRRRLPRSTVRACLTIGAQVALVLENLWLVEEARKVGRQTGVLRERQRMAHEIHDTLAQGFTSIVMNLEAAEGTLPPDLGSARHHLDQARLTARESLAEARRLVWALRPEPLEKASLPEALGRLAERWSEESGVAADVTVTGTPRQLSPEIEATLFRTGQEALANARKHARASRVALTLSYMGSCVTLDVRDDGVGFDPSRTATEVKDRTSGGFGLQGMRERIEQAGGSLCVESAPGEGSTLAVELPMIAPESRSPELPHVESAGRVP